MLIELRVVRCLSVHHMASVKMTSIAVESSFIVTNTLEVCKRPHMIKLQTCIINRMGLVVVGRCPLAFLYAVYYTYLGCHDIDE